MSDTGFDRFPRPQDHYEASLPPIVPVATGRVALKTTTDTGRFKHLLSREQKPEDEPWAQDVYEAQVDTDRTSALFAPTTTETEAPKTYDFSHLFLPDDQLEAWSQAKKAAAGNENTTAPPEQTSIGRESSKKILSELLGNNRTSGTDAKFAEIITKHEANHPTDIRDRFDTIIDAIHTDPELRLNVGLHFLGKIEYLTENHMHNMPERIVKNTGKQPHKPHGTLDNQMRSREYAALLCVDMLDGTFNPNDARSQPVDAFKKAGDFRGQHRWAANSALKLMIESDGTYIPDYAEFQK